MSQPDSQTTSASTTAREKGNEQQVDTKDMKYSSPHHIVDLGGFVFCHEKVAWLQLPVCRAVIIWALVGVFGCPVHCWLRFWP